jgi:chemosensory pili system protein ChpA (sensor histidine kinase/response regulator)
MQPEQQRIMGYFIEEAKEHLNTIEHSLLNLQSVVEDTEMLNEVFRAAHSVKGGAAMLGIYSVQQTAHRLEDYFKVLKEHRVNIDQKLESLFFRSFDTLSLLLEELQSPFGLTDAFAENALQEVEPIFAELQAHLTMLVNQSNSGSSVEQPLTFAKPEAKPLDSPLLVFQRDISTQLREMLQLFKQVDRPASRQQLEEICQNLAQLGEKLELPAWSALVEMAQLAIANPQNAYGVLAPVLIKEIRAAQDLVLAGRSLEIHPSTQLTALVPESFSWATSAKASSIPHPAHQSEIEIAELNSFAALFADTSPALEIVQEAALDVPEKVVSTEENWADLFDGELEETSGIVDSKHEDLADLLSENLFAEQSPDALVEELFSDLEADDLTSAFDGLVSQAEEPGPALETDGFGLPMGEVADDIDQQAAALTDGITKPDSLPEREDPSSIDFEHLFGESVADFSTLSPLEAESLALPTDQLEDWDELLTAGSGPQELDALFEGLGTEAIESQPPSLAHETSSTLEDLELLDSLFSDVEVAGALPDQGPDSQLVLDSEQLESLQESNAWRQDLDITEAAETASANIEPDFADLEALLEEESFDTASAQTSTPATQKFVNDDFEDLEKLIEDTDKAMGGATTTTAGRSRAAPSKLRASRRPGAGFEQTMKVPVKQLDNLSNLVGELVVNRNSLEDNQERLRQFLDNLLYQVQQLGDASQQMQELYDRSLLQSSLLGTTKYHLSFNPDAPATLGAAIDQSRHATGAKFDALEMDRFTGFHTLSQEIIERIVRVREAASDIEFMIDETDQVTRMLRQVTNQAQEGLTRSRMVPFAQIAERLPRAVRDLSLKCGKQAKLEIEGRETLVDKGILERLYDPMTHLVNNAIYHGIERPEVRQALGKSPEGQIKIKAFYQGNQTIISITDDGAGIDPERIKAKAVKKGLLTATEAETMSRLEVYNLLFYSGFSTQDKANDLAGRGVGMDVVRTSLDEMRGVINTDSTIGKGTTFTIRLPLTLSITKALCCIDAHCWIAFPLDGVEDMFDVSPDQIQEDTAGQQVLSWRDTLLPFRPLTALLPYYRQITRSNVYGGTQDDNVSSVIVLRSGGDLIAIQVDQVLGEQEIVIKQLSGPVPKPLGIAGVTVLGDGRVMPIADVLELIDLSLGRLEISNNLWSNGFAVEQTEEKTDPLVLVVDDSITVRELLSMTFNKIGYRVEQARDGQEAWEKLRAGLPCDLIFCDIEMPRMDGLELLSRIQKEPSLSHLPIAMLTSRGAARHRQMAIELGAKGYFTKPYLEEALLDAAQRMLKGEVLVAQNI